MHCVPTRDSSTGKKHTLCHGENSVTCSSILLHIPNTTPPVLVVLVTIPLTLPGRPTPVSLTIDLVVVGVYRVEKSWS